jgi:hypothetical protein
MKTDRARMPGASAAQRGSSHPGTPDERREWVRIDDQLLLEYRLATEDPDLPAQDLPPVTADMVSAAIAKPTADLLAQAGDGLAGSPLLPWIRKIDWLLEVLLKAVAAQHPDTVSIARVTTVNISGGGVSFVSPRRFSAGDHLSLTIIVPPFTPVRTGALVARVTATGTGEFLTATQFADLSPDDQEHIIRHVIQTQAHRLRARRASP